MNIETLTPEQRARALYYYFGWQGGTVHQLSDVTGIDPVTLLHGNPAPAPLSGGFSAVRTCSLEWRRDTLAPRHQGDWPYWRDVISGFWATGPLDTIAA